MILDGLTVIVPAKNEENNILAALKKVMEIASSWEELEVIFIDDGSTDNTSNLAIPFIKSNFSKYQIIKNTNSRNLGGVFKQGLQLASLDNILVVQGQNVTTVENLLRLFSYFNPKIDLVIPYQSNIHERAFHRVIISLTFTFLLRLVSGVHLRYFNHSVLMKTKQIRKLEIQTDSYAYQAEILIKLIWKGATYVEVPVVDVFVHKKRTSAFKWKNIQGVAKFFRYILKLRIQTRYQSTCEK